MELLESLAYMLNEMSPYILLGFFIAGLMHAFVPRRTMARHLSGSGAGPVFKAAMIGVPLPLCSCGVLPTAIAMRRAGASRAATTSFLTATPQTGVDSIAATWSLLGPAFAVVRPVAALLTALGGGLAVGRSEKPADADNCISNCETVSGADTHASFGKRLVSAMRYGFVDLVGSIGGWLTIGLVIAALITVYVPADFFAVFSGRPLLSMLLVLLVSVPMYVCATGSIPIALSLMLKGLSPGTALVLLMAGPAANFASFTLISRELGRRSAVIYLLSISAGAILFGLAVDYLLPAEWFAVGNLSVHAHAHGLAIFPTICSAILVTLLVAAFIRGHRHNHLIVEDMDKQYLIKGMNCPHCQASVARAIGGVDGVTGVDVNLSTGVATVRGQHDEADVKAAVRAAGFDVGE